MKHFMNNSDSVKQFKVDLNTALDAHAEDRELDEIGFIEANEEKALHITRMISRLVLDGARSNLKTITLMMNDSLEDQIAKIVLDQLGLVYTYTPTTRYAVPKYDGYGRPVYGVRPSARLSSNSFVVTIARPIEKGYDHE